MIMDPFTRSTATVAAGGGMLERVGERLLDDPVRRQVQIARQPQPWIHRQPGVDAGIVESSDEIG